MERAPPPGDRAHMAAGAIASQAAQGFDWIGPPGNFYRCERFALLQILELRTECQRAVTCEPRLAAPHAHMHHPIHSGLPSVSLLSSTQRPYGGQAWGGV